ncbi:MAG TPA: acyl-ACP--UDP-N-acetylglucosamine O-acyltransferase [Steroidobacteraceae bacterium]|jgi:UDP-N-acetylglucosamine acyltransferase|nr:acyl-ACP--UDP-N-acetylglucosamine O-acyltransferase [Steroidobacteraceae bacterium]
MIDPRAIVAAGAQLAADVEVGPFSIIGANVVVGAGSWIGPHVVLKGHTTIGRDNQIFQFSSIGEAPQDKKYAGEPTRLVIGDRNVIREYCTISCGTAADEGVTRIGDDNLFMAYTHVAHDCVIGNQTIMVNLAQIAGHVQIGDWVILSGYCAVHQYCKIGSHAFIAHHTGVTRDVPPYVVAVGNPAVPHSINSEGLKRRGFSADQIRNLRNAYRILYRSDLPLAAAMEQIVELAVTQPELKPFVDFIAVGSDRSLIR